MDPVVCVEIGEDKKYTSMKESTNCPYYNEVTFTLLEKSGQRISVIFRQFGGLFTDRSTVYQIRTKETILYFFS